MQHAFERRDDTLWIEQLSLPALAERFGTPLYVYSQAHLTQQFQALTDALKPQPHLICYAVKANSSLGVLRLFADLGSGFDIVSGGELERVIGAGGDPEKVVFSGVGKSAAEIDFALKLGIHCFNVESEAELDRLSERAGRLQVRAPVSVRVNPNIDAQTHPYISTGLRHNKFGVAQVHALNLYRQIENSPWLEARGLDCHIGSLIMTPGPLIEALDNLLGLAESLAADGIELDHLDLGGGFGVPYHDEAPFELQQYADAIKDRLGNSNLKLVLEPGRFLVANGGVLLTRVEYLKPAPDADGRNFAVVDAAMNDLIRPTLYQAWHGIEPVVQHADIAPLAWDIVGPVCESGDFLGHDRQLALAPDDLLVVASAGAYGFVQSSNYNSRNRAAEVLVNGDQVSIIRQRETISDQLALEQLAPWQR